MYRVWLFLHFAAVFGFLLSHGTSIAVAFRVRKERDPVRIKALVELSYFWVGMVHMGMFAIIITGVILGFAGHFWGAGWLWTSIGILILLWVGMSMFATRFYDRVRRGVGAEPFYGAKKLASLPPVTEEELIATLESSRPIVLAVAGVFGLLVIVWLMMFKPF